MRLSAPAGLRGYLPRPLFLAVCLLATVVTTSVAQAQITVQKLLEGVVEKIGPQHRDVEDAIELFQKGDVEGALNALSRARQANPDLPPAETQLAKLYFMVDNWQAAEQSLERAIQSDAQDPEAYVIQGDILLNQGRLNNAKLSYEQGLRLLQNYTQNNLRKKHVTIRALSGMSLVYSSLEDWKNSQEQLQQWLALEPQNVIAKERLAVLLFRQGKKQEAYDLFKEVYRIDNERTRPEIQMARLFASVDQDRARAEQLMRHAQKTDTTSLRTQVTVAEWALEAGILDLAKLASAAAEKIDPNAMEATVIAGLVAMFDNKPAEALKHFERAHLQSPMNAVAMSHLAVILIEGSSETDKRRALEFARLNASVYSNQNQRYSREAALTLAWVYHKLGESQQALRIMSRVLEQPGTVDSASLYLAARILHDVQQDEVARKILDAILEKGQNFLYREDAQRLRQELTKN